MNELFRLEAWLAEGGATHDGLEVRADGRRGVFAARPIAADTIVASVPRRLMITREVVRASSIGAQLRDAGVELANVHSLFAAWVLAERRNAGTPYGPYLDVLPRDFASFPLHRTPAELTLLAGSLTGTMVQALRDEIASDYARLRAKVRLFARTTLDELSWARLCVASRTYTVTVDGTDTLALIPFADMLNFEPGCHSRWEYDDAAAAFTIRTLRALAPGDELYGNYGAKANSRLLVQYGFVLHDNPFDEAALRLPTELRISRDPGALATKPVFDLLRRRYPDEAARRTAIVEAAQVALAGFATSASDDDALLDDAGLMPTARDLIVARRGEKVVLRAWLDAAAHGVLPP